MEITVKRMSDNETDEATYELIFETEDFKFQTTVPAEEWVRICKIVILGELEIQSGASVEKNVEIKH